MTGKDLIWQISITILVCCVASLSLTNFHSIEELKSHTIILAHSVQNLDYEISVLKELQSHQK